MCWTWEAPCFLAAWSISTSLFLPVLFASHSRNVSKDWGPNENGLACNSEPLIGQVLRHNSKDPPWTESSWMILIHYRQLDFYHRNSNIEHIGTQNRYSINNFGKKISKGHNLIPNGPSRYISGIWIWSVVLSVKMAIIITVPAGRESDRMKWDNLYKELSACHTRSRQYLFPVIIINFAGSGIFIMWVIWRKREMTPPEETQLSTPHRLECEVWED